MNFILETLFMYLVHRLSVRQHAFKGLHPDNLDNDRMWHWRVGALMTALPESAALVQEFRKCRLSYDCMPTERQGVLMARMGLAIRSKDGYRITSRGRAILLKAATVEIFPGVANKGPVYWLA